VKVQDYERLLRVKTTGMRSGLKKSAHHHRYEATPYSALDELFFEYDLKKSDVVVDFGCGKGRVPFYIHSRFQILVKGVEMSEELHQKALKNKANYRQRVKRAKGSIRFKNKLAENYKVKPEDNRFYFFNPFSIENFRKVVNNILLSIEEEKRTVDIILYYPTIEYIRFLERSTPFKVVQEIRVPEKYEKDDHKRFLIYRYKAD
jgi:SAM-dependent methyltransferase